MKRKYTRKAIAIILSSIVAFISTNYMLARLVTSEVSELWMDLWIIMVAIANFTIVYATYDNLKDNAELFRIEKEIKRLERRAHNV